MTQLGAPQREKPEQDSSPTEATRDMEQIDPPTRRRRPDFILVAIGAVIAVLCVLLLIPLVGLVWAALGPREGLGDVTLSLHNFVGLFTPAMGEVLVNTVLLGVGTVLISLSIAIPFAWLYTRTNLRGKQIILIAVVLKTAVPGFLAALGYIFLLNPNNGIINTLWKDLTNGGPLTDIYSLGWIIVLQGIDFAGPVFFMIVPTIRVIDVAIEESAAVHGISRVRAVLRLVLPVATPAIIGVAIFHFIIAIEVFDYPGVLGMPARVDVLSTTVFQFIQPSEGMPQYGPASALGIVMAIGIGIAMIAYYLSMRKANQLATITGKRSSREPVQLGMPGTIAAWSFISLYILVATVIPVLLLAWTSLLPYAQPPSAEALQQLSFDSYVTAWPELLRVLPPTLVLLFAVPTGSVILATCAAWVVTRTKLRGRKLLDVLIMVTLTVPSIVAALAFLFFGISTNRALGLYGTLGFLVMVVMARYVVIGYRTMHGNIMQVHDELEESAAVSGISRGMTFLRVVLPTLRGGLIFAWLWIALLAIRELTITVMFSASGSQVLATKIFGYVSAGNLSMAAALGVMHLCLIGIVLIVFLRFAKRSFI